jgi:prolyl 4-hydroxylase|tara:strand:+ start:3576 stop:4061 length:486 start_codon:yes stop_codon:yes gene_type:complete
MKNKIEMIDNFLSTEECNNLIDYYKNNKSMQKPHLVNNGKNIIDIDITEIKQFNNLFEKINKHVYDQDCKIEYTKIVKWTDDCSQSLHVDDSSSDTIYSSIIYLNHGYIGGQTFFEEGIVMRPLIGRALFFNGMYYKHGVMPVKKGPRYTLATWYEKRKND